MKYAKMFFGDTIFMFFARTILSSATADSAIACGDEILMYNSGLEGAGIGCWNWWWWGGGVVGVGIWYIDNPRRSSYIATRLLGTPRLKPPSLYIYTRIYKFNKLKFPRKIMIQTGRAELWQVLQIICINNVYKQK